MFYDEIVDREGLFQLLELAHKRMLGENTHIWIIFSFFFEFLTRDYMSKYNPACHPS